MEIENRKKLRKTIVAIALTGVLTATNVALSSFGVPVPGGHLYLNDVIISAAAIILNPACAFVVGGVGAFLGDYFFYPAPMFVSLAVHGLQAIVISVFARRVFRSKPRVGAVIGVSLGAVINVVGYSLGRAFIYSTPAYAVTKLPFQILQAVVGSLLGILLCYRFGMKKLCDKLVG